MCESSLSHFIWEISLFGRPISKCDLNPSPLRSLRPIRRRTISMDIFDSGASFPWAGKTKSPCRTTLSSFKIPSAAEDKGTRCSRLAFMRVGGIVHVFSLKSISSDRAPRTSPVRVRKDGKFQGARCDCLASPQLLHKFRYFGERQSRMMDDPPCPRTRREQYV